MKVGAKVCSWTPTRDTITHTFTRQAIPMTWDFAEVNPLSNSTGNFQGAVAWIVETLRNLPQLQIQPGYVEQRDATALISEDKRPLVFTTDPPYDNISYAELSDFFYVWLRHSLGKAYPQILSTLTTPKEKGEVARDLAYRLYSICDRKGWTQEAIAYNSLVISWSEISRLAAEKQQTVALQGQLEV